MTQPPAAERAPMDKIITAIADYALADLSPSSLASETAYLCLMDTLGCAFLALRHPACTRLLGPVVPAGLVRGGARVPGTGYELDPVTAAFNIGTLVRWLDFNDTWLAAEWGHPSDNLGALLGIADYLSRAVLLEGREPINMRALLTAMIKAHEIQGVLALQNSFNRVGLDHVLLVRVASTAMVCALAGATRDQTANAVSNAWVDGGSLRVYRHAPNTGTRKSWAAGDATARGVWHALLSLRAEMGYPSALTAPTWGFYDALYRGQQFSLPQPFGSYVMEHVLFKVAYPAEFHAQTAVEAAMRLHPLVAQRLDEVQRILIETQEAGDRIINKTGALANPADRDHCLQYMVAVPLIFGRLQATDYDPEVAADPRIDALRALMQVRENPDFTRDYLDPSKRYIGNAVQVLFRDGSATERVVIDYPLGHHLRRAEALPLLHAKFAAAVRGHFGETQAAEILELFADRERLESMAVGELMAALVLA
ncbi:MAG TPA: bifunctional 2-methylcitrate dehydratase/aconitate hydratase [Steroidobacteraceae bacterium]|jgi:2-methylcitrate dehydratase|nr:bifunctional 2-methylcitrate dehydratase/aconitate hydratase [Steroidobacteraceae bacterium]